VFNADDSDTFWEKMPTRTFISKEERHASGAKAAKDRLTMLFCANAAGHMIKAGLEYKAANPRALKRKNQHLLPVYWMHNKNAWITKVLFLQCSYNCFLVEFKKYLDDKGLPFKVLLVLNNAPGHPEPEEYSAEGEEVYFWHPTLPPSFNHSTRA